MMNSGKMWVMMGLSIVGLGGVLAGVARGGSLTIREIQYTESPSGDSPYNGKVIDCVGGVVFLKTGGGRPRLFLQDPNALSGWGAIQVKGWTSNASANVNVGDWVELKHVFVEENRGTTFLQDWDQNPDGSLPVLTVVSHGHSVPRPWVVEPKALQAPAYLPGEDAWVVADHQAEKFESMLLEVRGVAVAAQGLGKAQDNYQLVSFGEPNDATQHCWVSDYLNPDKPKADLYLSALEVGQRFRAVTGVLEQYTSLADGYDYYQLLTVSAAGVVGLCPADLDADSDVDLWDYQLFTAQLLTPSVPPVGDLNGDGKVDAADLDLFNAAWQQADRNGDGIVNQDDLDI